MSNTNTLTAPQRKYLTALVANGGTGSMYPKAPNHLKGNGLVTDNLARLGMLTHCRVPISGTEWYIEQRITDAGRAAVAPPAEQAPTEAAPAAYTVTRAEAVAAPDGAVWHARSGMGIAYTVRKAVRTSGVTERVTFHVTQGSANSIGAPQTWAGVLVALRKYAGDFSWVAPEPPATEAAAERDEALVAEYEANNGPAPVEAAPLWTPETYASIVRSSLSNSRVGEVTRFTGANGQAFIVKHEARNVFRLGEATGAQDWLMHGTADEVVARAFRATPAPEARPAVVLDLSTGYVCDPKYMTDDPNVDAAAHERAEHLHAIADRAEDEPEQAAPDDEPSGALSADELMIVHELEKRGTLTIRAGRDDQYPYYRSLMLRGIIAREPKIRGDLMYHIYRLVPVQRQVELQATERPASGGAPRTMYRAWAASPVSTAVAVAGTREVRVTATTNGFLVQVEGEAVQRFARSTEIPSHIYSVTGMRVVSGWAAAASGPVVEIIAEPKPAPEPIISDWARDMLTQAAARYGILPAEAAGIVAGAIENVRARKSARVLVGDMQNAIDAYLAVTERPAEVKAADEVTWAANAVSLLLTEANTMSHAAQKAMHTEAVQRARYHNNGSVSEGIVRNAAQFARALENTGGLG